jgi:uncharacterized protein (TIGR02118 family)
MVRVTLLYGHPKDTTSFDKYFKDDHVPLAIKSPGISRIESSVVKSAADGSQPPYHRITEVYFDDDARFQEFANSPEGKAALGDLDNFAKGLYTMLITEVDKVAVKEKQPARA